MGLFYDQAKALRLEIVKERVNINREMGDVLLTLFYEPGTQDYDYVLRFADGSENTRAYKELRKEAEQYAKGPSWWNYNYFSSSDAYWIPLNEASGSKVYLLSTLHGMLTFLLPGLIEKFNQETSGKSLVLKTEADESLVIKATCLYLYKIAKIILIYSSLWNIRHVKIKYLETIARHWTEVVQETESEEAVIIIENILEIIKKEESTIRESVDISNIKYSNYIIDVGAGSIVTAIGTFGGPVGVAFSIIYSFAIGPIEQCYAEKRVKRHEELITKMNELLTEYVEVGAPVIYKEALTAAANLEAKWQEIRVSFNIDEFKRYIKTEFIPSVRSFRPDYWNGIIDQIENLIICRVNSRQIRIEDIEPAIIPNGGDGDGNGGTGGGIVDLFKNNDFLKYALGGLAIGGFLTGVEDKSPGSGRNTVGGLF